jgi:autotransporter-associated beta strand protein
MKHPALFHSSLLRTIRAVAALFMLCLSGIAQAASFTFNGLGADGKFSTTANWVAPAPTDRTGDFIYSVASGGQTTLVDDFTGNILTQTFGVNCLPLTISQTCQTTGSSASLIRNNSASPQAFTGTLSIFGGTSGFNAAAGDLALGALTIRNDLTNMVNIVLDGASNGTVNGAISKGTSNGSLAKQGTGTWELKGVLPNLTSPSSSPSITAGKLILSAANTFSAPTRITAGTLQLNHASAMQSSTLDMNASDAGVLSFGSALTATTIGSLQGSRNIVLTNAAGNAVTLSVGNNTSNTTYTGILSGSGGLTKVGTGTFTLGADATFTGAAAVNNGYLALDGLNRLATVSGITVNGGQLKGTASGSYASRPLTLTGNGPNSQGALFFSVTATWPGAITLSGVSRIGAYNAGGSYTLSSGIGGTGDLDIWGGGGATTHIQTFILNGAGSYVGSTMIEATYGGNTIVQLGVNNGLPASTVLTLNSYFWSGAQMLSELKLNGKNQELAGLANTGAGVQRVVNGSATASTLTVNNALASTYSGILGGPGANENNLALTKKGIGVLTLSGTNTFTGGTAISNGTLFVNGRTPGAVTVNGGTLAGGGVVTGSVTVASGGGLNPGGAAASAGTLTVQGALTLAPGGTATFDLAGTTTVGGGVNDLLQLTGTSGSLALNTNAIAVNILAPLVTGTPYTIITFTGTRTGTLGTVSGIGRQPVTITYDDTPGAGKVKLTFEATVAAVLNWNSTSSSVWDVLTTANWTNTVSHLSPELFYPFDNVAFDDTPGVQTGITLGTTVTPNSVTVNSSANAFSLSGSGKISGYATLTKSGSSTFTVSNTNDYTGATTVNGRTLLLSGGANRLPPVTAVTLADTAGATLDLNGNNQTVASLSGGGASGGNVTLGAGSLTVAGTGTATYQGVISGMGSLVKSGVGTQTLANANSYSGGTTVSAGTLAVSGGGTLGTNTAALNANGGTLDLGVTSQTAGTVTIAGGTVRNGTLTGSAFAGQIGTVSATLAGLGTVLTKTGAGTLTLSGTNIFTGGTVASSGYLMLSSPGFCLPGAITFNGGIVQLGAAEQIADAAILTFTNAAETRLQLQGFNETVGGLQTAGGAGTRIVEAATDGLSNKPAALTLNVAESGAYIFDGFVRDASGATGSSLSVTKSGTGTQTFSGAASLVNYSGPTVINDGVLELSGVDSVANPSVITLNAGSVKFSGGGTRSALINGAGNVICAGTATLTLSGTNAYTGTTTINSNSTLSVTALANGGLNSSIGAAASSATNLVFDASTLSYAGPTASSDRGFTISAAKVATLSVTLTGTNLALTGSAPATTGFLKKTGSGTLTLDPGTGGYTVGALSADGGFLVLKSGTFATTGSDPAVAAYGVGAGARGGTLVIDGGALSVPGGPNLKIGASANGNVDIRSGTVNAANFVLGHNGTVVGTQSGGDVSASYLWHYDSGWATYTLTGGTLTTKRIYNFTASAGATFTLLLNGGIVRAAAGTANLLDNGGRTNTLDLVVQLGSVGATIDTSLSNATIVRPLDNIPGQAGRLTKIGAGTLTLTGTNTYSGAAVVSNGVLRLTHAQVLPSAADVYISSGATLQLDYTGTATIRRLYINGELMTVNVAYGAARRPAALSGTGYLFTAEGSQPQGSVMLLR